MEGTVCGPDGCRQLRLPDGTPELRRAFLEAWNAARDSGGSPAESPTVRDLAAGQLPLFDLSRCRRQEH